MKTPEELRQLAATDRKNAEEAAETNPMWAEYLEIRARWRDHLAREEEEFNRDSRRTE